MKTCLFDTRDLLPPGGILLCSSSSVLFLLPLPNITNFFSSHKEIITHPHNNNKMKLTSPTVLLTLAVGTPVHAFAPSRPISALSSNTALHVGAALDWNTQDLDENLLMERAEACAHSESCSLDEAKIALDDVIHVQSGCISGSVMGAVCENVDSAAEIVAHLREKIAIKTKQAM